MSTCEIEPKNHSKEWKKRNPEKVKEYSKKYYKKNRKHILDYNREYVNTSEYKYRKKQMDRKRNMNLKTDVLSHYCKEDIRCCCCGETNIVFLSLDHENNDGKQQRKKLTNDNKMHFYYWLKKNNYPQNLGLRTQCYNCNMGRSRNGGICPHKEVM